MYIFHTFSGLARCWCFSLYHILWIFVISEILLIDAPPKNSSCRWHTRYFYENSEEFPPAFLHRKSSWREEACSWTITNFEVESTFGKTNDIGHNIFSKLTKNSNWLSWHILDINASPSLISLNWMWNLTSNH